MFGYNMPEIANFVENVRALDVITIEDLRYVEFYSSTFSLVIYTPAPFWVSTSPSLQHVECDCCGRL